MTALVSALKSVRGELNALTAALIIFYIMVEASGLAPLDLVRGVVTAGLIAL